MVKVDSQCEDVEPSSSGASRCTHKGIFIKLAAQHACEAFSLLGLYMDKLREFWNFAFFKKHRNIRMCFPFSLRCGGVSLLLVDPQQLPMILLGLLQQCGIVRCRQFCDYVTFGILGTLQRVYKSQCSQRLVVVVVDHSRECFTACQQSFSNKKQREQC